VATAELVDRRLTHNTLTAILGSLAALKAVMWDGREPNLLAFPPSIIHPGVRPPWQAARAYSEALNHDEQRERYATLLETSGAADPLASEKDLRANEAAWREELAAATAAFDGIDPADLYDATADQVNYLVDCASLEDPTPRRVWRNFATSSTGRVHLAPLPYQKF
jgi:hypothetical protein